MILIAGSMICTTLSPIPRSFWWRGAGCGAIRARTAGVDGETARYIQAVRGVEGFLAECGPILRPGPFRPLPARRRAIPKAGGKVRYLGIATIRDRVAQASVKLVPEPVFKADFLPCSYGFRPGRRAHDAVAEIPYEPSAPSLSPASGCVCTCVS